MQKVPTPYSAHKAAQSKLRGWTPFRSQHSELSSPQFSQQKAEKGGGGARLASLGGDTTRSAEKPHFFDYPQPDGVRDP
jgi:hypothetical protein